MGGFLRFFFTLLLAFGLLALLNPKAISNPSRLIYYSVCDDPIQYHIGSIDQRFNISLDDFRKDIDQATSIWDQVMGKKLFTYDPTAGMSVNMVYDKRQSLNNQISDLESQVKNQENSLKPELANYQKRLAEFKSKLSSYNDEVARWNAKGGAPKEEFERLQKEGEELKKESDALAALAKTLNQSTSEYNGQISQLNKTINSFNQALSLRPEEGLYDSGENKIDIYLTNSEQELIHTLAHEFGHSLGLQHIQDEQAIMYYSTSEYITPVPDEIQALVEICRKRTTIEIFLQKMKLLLDNLQKPK